MSEGSPLSRGGIAVGSRVAGYLLEEQIGQGGMAVVFRAHDERLDRRVALKILAPALAADTAFRQRFIRESRAAAAVDDPHIIPVFEAGEADGVLFIAMRYVRGGDVRSLVTELGRLPPERAAEIVSQAASALDAAHGIGLVHRDVKPANILLDAGGGEDRPDHVYLSDFGLSKAFQSATGLTGTGQFLGTLDYIAPEQIEGKQVDGRADQYSLACAAFELLSGVPPFHHEQAMTIMYAQMNEDPPALTGLRPELHDAVDQVFAKALAKDPASRYATCREFSNAMRAALGLAARDTGPQTVRVLPADRPPAALAGSAASGSAGPGVPPTVTPGHPPAGRPAPPTMGVNAPVHQPATGSPWPIAAAYQASAPVQAPPQHRQRTGPILLIGASILVAAGIVAGAIVLRSGAAPLADAGHSSSPSTGTASSSSPGPTGSSSPSPAGSTNPGVTAPSSSVPTGYRPSGTFPAGVAGSISSVAWSPDGTLVATGDKNGSTYVWDKATGLMHGGPLTVPAAAGSVYAVAFSLDGTELAVGCSKGSTYLFSVATGARLSVIHNPPGSDPEVDSVAFSPVDGMLAITNGDGYTYLWDLAHGSPSLTVSLPDPAGDGVLSAVFSSQGMLATGDYVGHVYLWNAGSAVPVRRLRIPGGLSISALAFNSDGTVLAVGTGNLNDAPGNLYLWDVSGQNDNPIYSAAGTVWALAFNADDTLAMADGYGIGDAETYLWQVSAPNLTASLLGTLPDPGPVGGQGVGSLAFSGDGRWLVTGDTNGNSYLWKVG